MSPPKAVLAAEVANSEDPQHYEDEYVHSVYDEIAPHFSSTRYKPWPIIAKFLASLPSGWVGLDSGTGNGKYLPLPLDRPGNIWTVGMDRSKNLLEIAKTAGGVHREVVWGDVLGNPWRDGVFDYAISIATIHHLSTYARRKLAVKRLLQGIDPRHGRALIYVWAIEQDELSKRRIPQAQTVTQSEVTGRGQDVFVPWALAKQQSSDSQSNSEDPGSNVYNRYYHMFSRGELPELVREAAQELRLPIGSPPLNEVETLAQGSRGIEIVQNGWERSNYFVELRCWSTEGATSTDAIL